MRFISFLKITSDQRATHLTKQKAFNYKTCFQGLLGFEVQNGGHSTSTTENSTDCYHLKNQKIQLKNVDFISKIDSSALDLFPWA